MLGFLKKKEDKEIVLGSCADGEIIALEDVPDPVFSQKMMGDGIAVRVINDTIYAPIAGKITLIAETSHAFGITSQEGVEVMVHVGLETVNLKGKGFTQLVKVGDTVSKGSAILHIDQDFMKANGIDLITPIIILNHDQFTINDIHKNAVVKISDDLLKLDLKEK